MNNLTAFITGLGTGGLSCLAVQGGLLIGLLARQNSTGDGPASRWERLLLPVSGFLAAKLIIYTLFGLLLGLIGSELKLSITTQAWLQGLAAVFMVIMGVKLIWPRWLPWLNFTPPSFIRRLVKKSTKSELVLAPIILGALTIFIPCGATLAMEASALATGQAWSAAGIMFFFIIGTAPLFFIIGVLAKGTALLQRRLRLATAVIVVITGLYSFNAMLNMIGSPVSFGRTTTALKTRAGTNSGSGPISIAPAVINVLASGYQPTRLNVRAGEKVKIQLVSPGQLGCTSYFLIPKLKVEQQLEAYSTTTIEVTFPKPGAYTFTCGMGMYTGTFNAV